jgi:hypothetical protein
MNNKYNFILGFNSITVFVFILLYSTQKMRRETKKWENKKPTMIFSL